MAESDQYEGFKFSEGPSEDGTARFVTATIPGGWPRLVRNQERLELTGKPGVQEFMVFCAMMLYGGGHLSEEVLGKVLQESCGDHG